MARFGGGTLLSLGREQNSPGFGLRDASRLVVRDRGSDRRANRGSVGDLHSANQIVRSTPGGATARNPIARFG